MSVLDVRVKNNFENSIDSYVFFFYTARKSKININEDILKTYNKKFLPLLSTMCSVLL